MPVRPGKAPGQALDRGFIDVNAQIGPTFGRAGGATREALARERRSHGVRLSLVRHRTALVGDTRLGNRQLLEACEQDPGLIPIAVLRPDRTDMLDDASTMGARFAGFWLEGRARPGQGSLATDSLTRIYGVPGQTASRVRRFGMSLINRIGPVKDRLMAEARGTSGDLPLLLRGLPI